MSKLDDVLKDYGSGIVDNCIEIIDDPDFKFEKPHDKLKAEAKQQIKDLFLELIGEDESEEADNYYTIHAQNHLRWELQEKVNDL